MEGYNSDIRKLYPESRLCANSKSSKREISPSFFIFSRFRPKINYTPNPACVQLGCSGLVRVGTRCGAPRWLRHELLVVPRATSWRTRSTTDLYREEACTATPSSSYLRRSARNLARALALSKRGDVNCITLPLPPSNARRRAEAPVPTPTSATNVHITSSLAFVDSRHDRAREVASGWCVLDIAPSTRRSRESRRPRLALSTRTTATERRWLI